jgi:hypothetical protein
MPLEQAQPAGSAGQAAPRDTPRQTVDSVLPATAIPADRAAPPREVGRHGSA